MAYPQVAEGRTASNVKGSCDVLNKWPQTAERVGPPAEGLDKVLKNSSP